MKLETFGDCQEAVDFIEQFKIVKGVLPENKTIVELTARIEDMSVQMGNLKNK